MRRLHFTERLQLAHAGSSEYKSMVGSSSFPKIILYARVRPDRRDVIITICCVMIAKMSFFVVRLSEIGGHPADVPWLEGTVGREFNGTLEVRGCVTGTLRASASK